MVCAVNIKSISKHFKRYREKQPRTIKERVIFFRRDKAYEEFWALKDVTFEIEKGKTFGLIGANGSGKSTLLKILSGILRPTQGEVRISGRVGALLELGAGFHPDLTGRENIYLNASILGMGKKQVHRLFDAIVDFAELRPFIDNQVRHYSSGMYVRLGFAVAVHMDPDILLVDEVLAVGDEAFQDKCLERIRQFQSEGRTIVVVTHAVDVVRQMCDQAALLTHGRLTHLGSPTEAVRAYREEMALVERALDEGLVILETARVKSVKIVDDSGQKLDVVKAGDSMIVQADIEVTESIRDPVVDVNIYDNSGVHIFGTNSYWRSLPIDLDPGTGRIEMRFQNIPMREGRFFLVVGIHSADGSGTIYGRSGRIPFEAKSDSDEPGRLYLPCTFSAGGSAVRRSTIEAS